MTEKPRMATCSCMGLWVLKRGSGSSRAQAARNHWLVSPVAPLAYCSSKICRTQIVFFLLPATSPHKTQLKEALVPACAIISTLFWPTRRSGEKLVPMLICCSCKLTEILSAMRHPFFGTCHFKSNPTGCIGNTE